MKSIAILTLTLLLLISCGQKTDTQTPLEAPVVAEIEIAPLEVIETKPITPIEEIETKVIDSNQLSIRAKYLKFWLGDAEHYAFITEAGERISFGGCEVDNFEFYRELSDAEANSDNQGWGANSELVGKWFKLTYYEREQPLYQDGPMGMVQIINKAVLDE
jgi:hypothetical protein